MLTREEIKRRLPVWSALARPPASGLCGPEQEVRERVLRVVNRPRWLRWIDPRPNGNLLADYWSAFPGYLPEEKHL